MQLRILKHSVHHAHERNSGQPHTCACAVQQGYTKKVYNFLARNTCVLVQYDKVTPKKVYNFLAGNMCACSQLWGTVHKGVHGGAWHILAPLPFVHWEFVHCESLGTHMHARAHTHTHTHMHTYPTQSHVHTYTHISHILHHFFLSNASEFFASSPLPHKCITPSPPIRRQTYKHTDTQRHTHTHPPIYTHTYPNSKPHLQTHTHTHPHPHPHSHPHPHPHPHSHTHP